MTYKQISYIQKGSLKYIHTIDLFAIKTCLFKAAFFNCAENP